jgi:hypothetical protein
MVVYWSDKRVDDITIQTIKERPMSKSYDEDKGRTVAESQHADAVMVPIPRELIERDFMFELMALSDERLLSKLSEEDRQRLGDNPAGELAYLTTDEIAQIGSFSHGVLHHGTPSYTQGVVCKIFSLTIEVGVS